MATNMENLPEHLLLDIFALVPAIDLIYSCRLVCSQWQGLVDLPVLWKRKYQEKDNDSSPEPLDSYILSFLMKNLIKNPDGQDGLDSWEIQTPAEGYWKIEELSIQDSEKVCRIMEPNKCQDYLRGDGHGPAEIYKCFAAHNGPCSKSQLITLKDKGYWDELMDEARPTIVVEDCFSRKPGSCYKLTVKLLSADSVVLEDYQYEGDDLSDYFFKVSHTFYNYPPGVRHILFEHKGYKEDYHPRQKILKLHFPVQGPSEDTEPSWGGIRMLKSSITLLPPPPTKVDYDYENFYHDPHTSSDESTWGFGDPYEDRTW